ncbi:MBL fold metallo-hydrolase [Muricomes intestini]|jgi:glyoxylase-like metal-dependent hydrolase (beta-lactamase superfamily II)|uniref:MBL fold metallo-hydrolase n=1 Tax=Muricomes intestini TaxID=1796634 RepID=UPI000E863F34|nr:MBL fold metallo-hydrolase [Lachnospiraceae bacterium]HCR83227.1 MBL fold metallo-hydrolase [Lachnospiraceae bacterium]
MKIERFVIGIISTNCYLVQNEESKECFLIDPGACPGKLVDHIKSSGLEMKAILLTHGHFDHIMGIDGFLNEFPVPVYVHEAEKELLEDAALNSSATYGPGYTFSGAHYLKSGEKLTVAGLEVEAIYTPGHTAGGCCYYIQSEGVLFSGDTLFCASIGRTDFPTGSSSQLIRSIQDKLMCLPGETKVYPGHMDETTIAFEQTHNPFL